MGTGIFNPGNHGAQYTYLVPEPYVRPADWLDIRSGVLLGQQKVVFLAKVESHDSNFASFNFQGSAGYTVDWGDGVVENFASNTAAHHRFLYANHPGTESSRGYRQAIVTVTPQGAGTLTLMNLNIRHIQFTTQIAATLWLDIVMVGANFASITCGVTSGNVVFPFNLEQFEFIGPNNIISAAGMFSQCASLQNVVQFDSSKVTSFSSMFLNCTSLRKAPMLDTSSGNNMSNMFNNCQSLIFVPSYNTANVTIMSDMFNACSSLQVAPYMDTQNVTTTAAMFFQCYSLIKVPAYNLSKVISTQSMFNTCYSLQYSPPFITTSTLTNTSNMFTTCTSLVTVGLFETSGVTTMASMFQNNYSLAYIPPFNTQSVTTMSSMFSGCRSIRNIPMFNTSAVTVMTSMFASCESLVTIPLLNTGAVTLMNSMFNGCDALVSLPALNTQNVTSFSSFLLNCKVVVNLPVFDCSKATNMTSMYDNCSSLVSIPALNSPLCTNFTDFANGCEALSSIGAVNMSSAATTTTMFTGTTALSSNLAFGIGVTFGGGSGGRMSKAALETLMTNMKSNVTGQTFTISTQWGNDAVVAKNNCGTTAGSTVITQTNTLNVVPGQLCYGPGISDAVAVTFQDAGDTVTRTAHGLVDGNRVSFTTIVTTTGIILKTPYYVVNATANTFQVSLTQGGAPLALTTNGSGTMLYGSYVVSVNTNVSITLDKPASASGAGITLNFKLLDISIATMKGWSVI